jgi:hypothetical protein
MQEDQPFAKKPSNFHSMSLSFLILVPVFVYFANSSCHIFAYHMPVLKSCVTALSFCLAALFMVLRQTRPGAPMYWFNIGLLCFIACLISLWSCMHNYKGSLEVYYEYEGQTEYTNVVPTEPATAYLDAGKIVFSKGSHIDFSKYASIVSDGTTYCVAPVIGGTLAADTASFWAAGLNCCHQNFTCDASLESQARSGLVYLLPKEQELFLSATNRSLTTALQDVLFVRWVDDVDKAEAVYFNAAVGYLSASTVVYLVCSIVIGFCLHFGQRRPKESQT